MNDKTGTLTKTYSASKSNTHHVLSALLALLVILLTTFTLRPFTTPHNYQDATIEERADDLLQRMILDEKVAQLQCLLRDIEGSGLINENGIGGLGCILRPYPAGELLLEAVRSGMISEEILDRSVRRVLVAKFKLGLFENP